MPAETTERTPAGRVFLELAVRLHNAARAQDQPRMDALMTLLNGLEAEFPAETAAEKELHRGN